MPGAALPGTTTTADANAQMGTGGSGGNRAPTQSAIANSGTPTSAGSTPTNPNAQGGPNPSTNNPNASNNQALNNLVNMQIQAQTGTKQPTTLDWATQLGQSNAGILNPDVSAQPSLSYSGGVNFGTAPSGNAGSLINNAKSWLGVPYVYGGTSRAGVDCSGFTQAVYSSMGLQIGRDTSAQLQSGHVVGQDGNWNADVAQLQPGDLIFYGQPGASGPNAHVTMYIGNGQVIEASHSGTPVRVLPLYSAASSDEPFLGVRRYM